MSTLSHVVESFVNRQEHACGQCASSHLMVTRDAEHNVVMLEVNKKPAIHWNIRENGRIHVLPLNGRFNRDEIDDIRSFMEALPHAYPIERLNGSLHLDPDFRIAQAANESISGSSKPVKRDDRQPWLSRFFHSFTKGFRS